MRRFCSGTAQLSLRNRHTTATKRSVSVLLLSAAYHDLVTQRLDDGLDDLFSPVLGQYLLNGDRHRLRRAAPVLQHDLVDLVDDFFLGFLVLGISFDSDVRHVRCLLSWLKT